MLFEFHRILIKKEERIKIEEAGMLSKSGKGMKYDQKKKKKRSK